MYKKLKFLWIMKFLKPIGMSILLISDVSAQSNIEPNLDRASWMFEDGRFGAGTHFLAGGRDINYIKTPGYRANPATTENWEAIVNNFDVEVLAQDLQDSGVGWFLLTLGQTRGFMLTHSEIYDNNSPLCSSYVVGAGRYHRQEDVCAGWDKNTNPNQRANFTPTRDLINDLADALHRKGIRMVVYSAYESPSRWHGGGGGPSGTQTPQWYVDYHKSLSERWGKKIDAWWIDGFYPENGYPKDETTVINGVNLQDHSDALRSGNPNRVIVAYNRGRFGNHLSKTTNREEYTDGTLSHFAANLDNLLPQLPNKRTIGSSSVGVSGNAQWHLFTPLEGFEQWGNYLKEPRFTNKQIATYMRTINSAEGVATFDVGIETNGNITEAYKTQLTYINYVLDGAPVIESIIIEETDTGITYSGTWTSALSVNDHGGSIIETINNDDYFEYTFEGTGIDVIMRRETFADGQVPNSFEVHINGNLIQRDDINGNSVATYTADNGVLMNQVPVVRIRGLEYGSQIIRVYKTGGDKLQLDALRIIGASGWKVERINDTNENINYSADGNWYVADNRPQEDYKNDIHGTTVGDAYAEYTFEGNGIRFIGEVGPDGEDGPDGSSLDFANVEVLIDNISYGTFVTKQDMFQAQHPIFETSLIYGSHTIRVVNKENNRWMFVDAFDVLNTDSTIVNNNKKSITYSSDGNWYVGTNRSQANYNHDITGTRVNGAYAEMKFVGTGATFFTEIGPGFSEAIEVLVDGVSQGNYNLQSSNYATQYAIFSISELVSAEHTIRVINRTNANEWMLVDAFSYINSLKAEKILPSFGTKITLKSLLNGKYLSIDTTDGNKLKAVLNEATDNTLFTVLDAGNGLVALQAESGSNSNRIRCIAGQPGMACDSNGGNGSWSHFRWEWITSETIRLLPLINNPNTLRVNSDGFVDNNGGSVGLETQFVFDFIN